MGVLTAQSRSVGLDIGTTGIRAVELKYNAKKAEYELVRALSVDFELGEPGRNTARTSEKATKSLKSLWRKGRFSTRKVTFAAHPTAVLSRQSELPWMPPEDFAAALPYQVQDLLPVDIATLVVDYQILEDGAESGKNKILLLASDSQAITAESQLVRKAHLTPVAADSSALALIRTTCKGSMRTAQPVTAIVDIGVSQITIVVHDNGTPTLIRTLSNLGINSALESLVRELDLDWQQAWELVWGSGLESEVPNIAPIAESSIFATVSPASPALDPRTDSVNAILGTWASALVREVRDSVDYYRSGNQVAPVEKIVLTGRSAFIPGLENRMATQIPLPVELLAPLAGLAHSPKVRAADFTDGRFAVAIGLAMTT